MDRFPKIRDHVLLTLLLAISLLAACSNSKNKAVKSTRSAAPVDFASMPGMTPDAANANLFYRELETGQSATQMQFSIVEDSGIEFTNTFNAEGTVRLIETGAGVATADYDGDGEVDIYLLATEGPNKLYRGLGNFKFEDVTAEAGVDGTILGKNAWGAGASFADVDNDGDLDLFVCNMASRDLLYINQGDGTFKEEGVSRRVSLADASKIGTFCDYDLDGDLDLYVVTYRAFDDAREPQTIQIEDRTYIHPDFRESFGFVHGKILESGQSDFLLENDGNGFFTDVTSKAQVMDQAMGLSALWMDYNNDGFPDLYVANDFWQADRLFKNNGDGTFNDILPEAAQHTTWFSKGCDSGDLNNDGLTDLMVGDVAGASHARRLLTKGVMEVSPWFLDAGAPRQYKRNSVFVNSGMDKMMDVAHMTGMANTGWTWATRMADLNNDGWQDVFITTGTTRDVLDSDTIEKLKKLRESNNGVQFNEVIRTMPPIVEPNRAYVNRKNLQFEEVGSQWGLDLNGISHGVSMADLDHDGDLDMIVNNMSEPVSVYRNDSANGNRMTVSLRSNTGNTFGYGAKIEVRTGELVQTKVLNPVRGYLSSDQPIVHFGLGDASQIDLLRITWPGGKLQEFNSLNHGCHYLVVEDADASVAEKPGGSKAKTAFQEDMSNAIEFTHFDGASDDFARQPLLPYRTSQLGPGVALGDINNDGLTDVFLCSGNDRSSSLLVNRGGSFYEEVEGPWTKQFLQDDMSALFFDANGDGFEDLLVTSGGSEYELGNEKLIDRLFLNRQQEAFEFSPRSMPTTEVSSSTAAAFDFDRDGDLDLAIGARSIPHQYPLASRTQLLRNDKGAFVEVNWKNAKSLLSIGISNSILCTDFNNDGWTDLVLAIELGPVRFLENRKGKFHDVTAELGVEKFTGWWRGLAAGDFDNDGDLDYVATNQGINTKYKANSQHPWRIYYGDVDKSGRKDLIESEYEDGVEYPARGLTKSSTAIPEVAKKFKTFESFARAPLSEIYNLKIPRIEIREVNFPRSAIFWNEGGSMRIEPLPRMAQTSPGFGVEAFDHDCDGDIDILLANNFFSAESQTGYMDGGVGALLENDGSGKFTFVWPNQSGVALEGDSKGLATVDIDNDGDRDAIVTAHSGKVRTLVNQSDPGQYKRLTIVGHPWNQKSIGATVVAKFQNGSSQRHEVRAGGSYLSQSTSDIFLYEAPQNPLTKIQVTWPTGETAELEGDDLGTNDTSELEIDVSDYSTD